MAAKPVAPGAVVSRNRAVHHGRVDRLVDVVDDRTLSGLVVGGCGPREVDLAGARGRGAGDPQRTRARWVGGIDRGHGLRARLR